MALKALMLRKKIDDAEAKAKALREESDKLKTREAELETAINEASNDEEKQTVEGEVEKFENEKKENEDAIKSVEDEISDLKEQLAEEEEKQVADETPAPTEDDEERKGTNPMVIREKMNEMETIVRNEEVKEFLGEVRTCVKEKRAIANSGLTIPEVMLPLLEQTAVEASKLLSKVNLQKVGGKAREVIMGLIPEAVWTEMCANLNELDLTFNNVEVDGYKVGGYFALCNAILEDNDVQLASRIISTLGNSIGKALDKAIVYGTGNKMPLGFVTRLAQDSQPSDYPTTARPWVDLRRTNIIPGTGATGIDLFKEIVRNTKNIYNDYFDGLVWIMNKKTHTDVMVASMGVNSAAAITAGMNSTMPVVGGEIIELPFMADGDIAAGYLEAYLLAQRAGTQIGQSEHVKFIEDQTVFKGTARYDGTPVIAEAFEIMSITESEPATRVDFPEDKANPNPYKA